MLEFVLSHSQIASTFAGSHWAGRVQADYAMVVMSPVWKVVDNDFFSGCEDPEFQRRKKFYIDFIAPNPAPQKAQFTKKQRS